MTIKEGNSVSIKEGVTIKEGDIVRVTKPVNREQYWDEDTGYGECWVTSMDEFDGDEVVVDNVDIENGIFYVRGCETGWGFPFQCISEVIYSE